MSIPLKVEATAIHVANAVNVVSVRIVLSAPTVQSAPQVLANAATTAVRGLVTFKPKAMKPLKQLLEQHCWQTPPP